MKKAPRDGKTAEHTVEPEELEVVAMASQQTGQASEPLYAMADTEDRAVADM